MIAFRQAGAYSLRFLCGEYRTDGVKPRFQSRCRRKSKDSVIFVFLLLGSRAAHNDMLAFISIDPDI